MSAPIHTEIVFEDEVCEHLKAHGWLCDGPLPFQKGFAYDAGYDTRLGLFPADALVWVKETQPDTWAKFAKNHTQDPEGVFLRRLAEELDRDRPTIRQDKPQLWGKLYVLRKGFEDINATFRMAQFAPGQADHHHHIAKISLCARQGRAVGRPVFCADSGRGALQPVGQGGGKVA